MIPRHRLMIAIFGLALLASALPALAQLKGHGPHGPGPGMEDHRLERLAERLELSDGQVEELRQAFAARSEQGAEVRRGLFEARRALEAQIHGDSFDESAIRAAAAGLAALEADMAVERARQVQKLGEILTTEQLAELQQMRGDRRRHGRRGPRDRRFGGPPPPGE